MWNKSILIGFSNTGNTTIAENTWPLKQIYQCSMTKINYIQILIISSIFNVLNKLSHFSNDCGFETIHILSNYIVVKICRDLLTKINTIFSQNYRISISLFIHYVNLIGFYKDFFSKLLSCLSWVTILTLQYIYVLMDW